MKRLVIEKSALKNNITVVKSAAGRSCIYANLSCDAYGAGVVEVAKLLREEGIARFAVDDVAAAVALREAGLVDEEILMLRSLSDKKALEKLLDHNVVCSIGNLEAGVALNALAAERATVAEAHLQVDCGMGFGGFPAEEPDKMFGVYQNLNNVAVSGVYTQLHSDDGERGIEAQLRVFSGVVEALRAAGYETGTVHAAGSYALLHYDISHLDAVRAGSVLLGRCEREKGDGLQTVGHGEATVDDIRWLPKGHTVGADHPITLKKPTRVAVLPVGYLHGFGVERPRDNGFWAMLCRWRRQRKASVVINGQRAKVIGRIGATETVVSITNLKCSAGDVASFELDPMFARGFVVEYR